ncbi:Exodeoxyribonuclease V beta chain [hydrothermal vent metagenome]|uniref:DNA 3'-5' helicase n=1 Tax=hydrothermal vent metagenome TaxID=652676 RepID=A0A3B0ZRR8_9ZZZZ
MNPINTPLTAPLQGVNFIEASAGTGKTWTIAALYLRLLLEKEFTVEQILVVTYTNAATDELRDRIRQRLRDVKQVLLKGQGDDVLLDALLANEESRQHSLKLVEQALTSFDLAPIFTIHGFCQRVLSDQAFESGITFRSEILTDERHLLQAVVEDYWRQHLLKRSTSFTDYLLYEAKLSPQKLVSELRFYINREMIALYADPEDVTLDNKETELVVLHQKIQQYWLNQGQEIRNLLLKASSEKVLKNNIYAPASLPSWFDQLNLFLQSESPFFSLYFDKFDRFTKEKINTSTGKGKVAPEHLFFDICENFLDEMNAVRIGYKLRIAQLKKSIIVAARTELAIRKNEQKVMGYDDLLSGLWRALNHKQGNTLIEAVVTQYPVALVDEFQDTDPLQYRIFSKLYGNSKDAVFMVGDPKQAIYSFRGADLFSYLQARQEANHIYSLNTNWRSTPAMVNAVNALFSQHSTPFLFSDIQYRLVEAAAVERDELSDENGHLAALQIWRISSQGAKHAGRTETLARVSAATADEIARLLIGGQQQKVCIGERGVNGGDIAVLVRSHMQAQRISDALREVGVASVQYGQDNVFLTDEMTELWQVLLAVAEPNRESVVNAALLTEMMGRDARILDQLSLQQEATLMLFHRYHQLWKKHGFIRMMRELLFIEKITPRLLALADGDRRVTNVSHIIERIHVQVQADNLSMEGVLSYMADAMQGSVGADEESMLRLESDEELVKIVTIHKSKGLEYPIVFCPFVWADSLKNNKADPFTYHDEQNGECLVLSGEPNGARLSAIKEELAENLRLLYVAVTRAKYRCYMAWGAVSGVESSALSWLLFGAGDDKDDDETAIQRLNRRVKNAPDEQLFEPLLQLQNNTDKNIALLDLPEPDGKHFQILNNTQHLQAARSFTRNLNDCKFISSFTGLTAHPSHSIHSKITTTFSQTEEQTTLEGIHAFPRGARAGIFMHSIFEQWDFSCDDDHALAQLVEKQIKQFNHEWLDQADSIVAMIKNVTHTVLLDDAEQPVQLSKIAPDKCIVELEFTYPIAEIQAATLNQLLAQHALFSAENPDLNFKAVKGYLKGFIDLVFEHNEKFYIIDYKSNWLGTTQAAYSESSLPMVITEHRYYFQYVIYTLAVHRLLKQRMSDYDYESHFGGVFYLFIRGMTPGKAASHGVYFDKPSFELIAALDAYFDRTV